jgi:hypothetical protein
VLGFELSHQGRHVIAHQVELVNVVLVGRMHRNFGRRQRKDQPSVPGIYRTVPEHVAKERTVPRGVLAVDDDVRSLDLGMVENTLRKVVAVRGLDATTGIGQRESRSPHKSVQAPGAAPMGAHLAVRSGDTLVRRTVVLVALAIKLALAP